MDLLIPLALAALLIFFLFNSRRKQKARAAQIKTGLTPGATVMTTFGVFGTVLSIDEENNQVTIESGPGTVLRVHRQAIGQVDSGQSADAPIDAPADDSADSATAGAGAGDAASTASGSEKPAITDAELDAMNARKRNGGAADVDSSVDDVDAPAADDAVAADDLDSTVESSDAADPTVTEDNSLDAEALKSDSDVSETNTDVSETNTDGDDTGTDKKN